MNENQEVLCGQEALDLWRRGTNYWNTELKRFPRFVDFSGVKFNEIDSNFSFAGYVFPKGVDFSSAIFGGGSIDFSHTQFGKGLVSFFRTDFGLGNVSFRSAQFGEGDVNFKKALLGGAYIEFRNANFGYGNVDFREAQFGKGEVDFVESEFCQGHVSFRDVQFGGGVVNFWAARFGLGYINFKNVCFGKGEVLFRATRFGRGGVSFERAQFKGGDISFREAQFEERDEVQFEAQNHIAIDHNELKNNVSFESAKFGNGSVDFTFSNFNGAEELIFTNSTFEDGVFTIKGFEKDFLDLPLTSFRSSSMSKHLQLVNVYSRFPLDFIGANINRPMDLDNVKMGFATERGVKRMFYLPYVKSKDSIDETRFRRLKKLAKDAEDHQRALDFWANEVRASYGHGLVGTKLFWFLLYDLISDFGRSITRPVVGLASQFLFFSTLYFFGSTCPLSYLKGLSSSSLFSMSYSLPIYAGSRSAKLDSSAILFGAVEKTPDWVHWVTVLQGMISGVLIFLILLALRNRFRT